ncbi:calcium-binding protein [Muricoccus pecuniae]|uniref:Ca2+-binding RTX toxin-like protein n=1 Tax=Muricoccus pecuniae TaxID=693023 RepID=A0A840Y0B4_9PROT|nr:calcium-binding protein [Roseomonas pecuniae]MBB5694155.1 Ca2+-binding RTX toxin-like protein [Roseomonas pecuniae]
MALKIGSGGFDFIDLSRSTEPNTVYANGYPDTALELGNNVVLGGSADDSIRGGFGHDLIIGGQGDDVIFGYGIVNASPTGQLQSGRLDLSDFLSGGAGDDLIVAGGGDDLVLGGTGNDALRGDQGNDFIAGGSGDDFLRSGAGSDILVGGCGSDVFYYNFYPAPGTIPSENDASGGRDVILDFHSCTDQIDLSGLGVARDELELTDIGTGLLLSFPNSILNPAARGEIELRGLHHIGEGDIIFS